MRTLSLLFVSLSILLFTACDPKSDQRAPRFTETDCPTCVVNGVCRYCEGSTKCTYCSKEESGKRNISTESYAGEGLNIVSISTECAFCKGSGNCHHCNGKGTCLTCSGTGNIDKNWDALKREPKAN